MRYGSEQKARTRERVLKEAVVAIRAGGPDKLGVADVMKRVGLTHGGFYAHFDSRESLLTAAFEELFSSTKGVFERQTNDLAPRDALRAYLKFYLSRQHRDAREVACPLPLLVSDLPRMNTRTQNRFNEAVERLTAAMADKLRLMGLADPEAAAGSALHEMVGALALARAVGRGPKSDAILGNARAALSLRLGLEDKP